MKCELCEAPGGRLLWKNAQCRVVEVAEPGYPGFCRVIWNAHVREMTDLPVADRSQLMEVVFAVESALRETLAPHKINLASLGNVTPHLHWHVIPRSPDDPHFPEAVWAARRREPAAHASDALTARLIAALGARLR